MGVNFQTVLKSVQIISIFMHTWRNEVLGLACLLLVVALPITSTAPC
jgi:hypothetical protein